MKRNMGTCDAMLRMTCGLVGLAYSIVCAKGRVRRFPIMLATIFSFKIAMGVLRYCPFLDIFDRNTLKDCLLPNNQSIILQNEQSTD